MVQRPYQSVSKAKESSHKQIPAAGQTAYGKLYAQVLRRLKDRVRRVQPEITDWIFHQDAVKRSQSLDS